MGKVVNKIIAVLAALTITAASSVIPANNIVAVDVTVLTASADSERITGEFHPVLRPFDSRKYTTDADIVDIENTDELVAVISPLQNNRQFTVYAAMEGTAEITVRLSNGDVYKIYVTVDGNAETTPVTTDTRTTSSTTISSSTESTTSAITTSATESTASSAATSSTDVTDTSVTSAHFDIENDVWSFNNSSPKFRNKDGMILLENELEKLEQIKKIYAKHTLNEAIDRFISSPEGACYGMSLLDLIYVSDKEHYLPLIQAEADTLSSVKLTDEIKSKINYYSLLQLLPEMQYSIADSLFNENDTSKLKRIMNETQKGPVLVCYSAKQSKDSSYAHAVLAYDTSEYVPDDDDQNFLESLDYDPDSDSITIIKVYDPKYTGHNDEADIYVNVKNRGTDKERMLWGIKENYTYNMSISDKTIMFVSNDLDLMDRYGLFNSFDDQSKSDQEMYPQLYINENSDEDGKKKYRINVDPSKIKWIGSDSPEEDPFITAPMFYSDGSGNQVSNCILKYPELDYNFEYTDGKSGSAELRMSYTNSTFGIKADRFRSVYFAPDCIRFELTGDSKFEVSAVSDEQTNPSEFYSITVAGTASGKIELKNDNGHWQISSDKPLTNVDIYASNDYDCNDQHRNYTSGSNTIVVMYSKQNKTKIGISEIADSDTDTASPGDVNGDGIINAVDASKILVLYAGLSAGETEADDNDFAVCDINGDKLISAVDASLVLAYYASLAQAPDLTLEAFLEEREK